MFPVQDQAVNADLIRVCEWAAEDTAHAVWDVEDVVEFYGRKGGARGSIRGVFDAQLDGTDA